VPAPEYGADNARVTRGERRHRGKLYKRLLREKYWAGRQTRI
jgi:hypothetical protein